MTFGRRVWTFALAVLLGGAPVIACSGWTASPAARMACCKAAMSCPMESHDSGTRGSAHNLTQAAADACCAAADHSSTSPSAVVASASLVVVQHPFSGAPAPTIGMRFQLQTHRALIAAPVPKHLLLGVFLL
jgi:hypothetical protein